MRSARMLKQCRICNSSNLYKFLNLGKMPLANKFLREKDLNKERNFQLSCLFCQNCGLVQLDRVVNPELMFKNYLYIPSTARLLVNDFYNLAYHTQKKLGLTRSSLVIDVGSNDGSLLSFFKKFQAKVLGIDPAENLKDLARQKGVDTEVGFLNKDMAKKIVSKYGQADLITATNVVAHIDNLFELFESIGILLKEDGLFVTEFHYLLDLITKTEFDTIYHEHLSYFSLKPWQMLLEKTGFEVVDVRRIPIHGGSIRLTHRKKRSKNNLTSKNISYLINLEENLGLYDKKTYENFAFRIERLKIDLMTLLNDLKGMGKRIVGLGAPAKGNILMNFFDIGTTTLDYIADSIPYKQGLFTPGKHIPIYKEEVLLKDKPDFALIFAWNFANEIIKKQAKFKKNGGRFIIPIPEVTIV